MKPLDPTISYEAPRRSWLEASGQAGKFRLMFFSLLWIFGARVLGSYSDSLNLPAYTSETISAVGAILFVVFLLYPVVAIRCRKCHTKVLAYFMSTSSFHRWFSDVQSTTRCPKCGDDGHDMGAEGEKSVRHVA
jgi:hypothetical protein